MSKVFDFDFRNGSNKDKIQGLYAFPRIGTSSYSQQILANLKGWSTNIPEYSNSTTALVFPCYRNVQSNKGTFIIWVYLGNISLNGETDIICGSKILQLYGSATNRLYYTIAGTQDLIYPTWNKWTQLVITFDCLFKRTFLYVNSILNKTTTNAGTIQYVSVINNLISFSSNLGQSRLMRFQSFDHILTQKEINDDYKQFSSSKTITNNIYF